MTRVLYDSNELFVSVRKVLSDTSPGVRRVILVAYLGDASTTILPNPRGLQIICNPTPGATSHRAITELIRRGAEIRFSDSLHMKVYWSSSQGVIICSANLSSNAFAKHSLHEAGVYLKPGSVDVDKLISFSRPYAITKALMDALDRESNRRLAENHSHKTRKVENYLRWFSSPYPRPWKFGWWSDNELTTSVKAKERIKKDYSLNEGYGAMNVPAKSVTRGDWLLCFDTTTGKPRDFEWMFVDFAVPVRREERGAYEKRYPYQAIQVHPPRNYPDPPFQLDPHFKRAFVQAAIQFGIDRIKSNMSLRPTRHLLQSVANIMRQPSLM